MESVTDIVKNLLLPKLEKDSEFSNQKTDLAFWVKISQNLLLYSEDATPACATIYNLKLQDAEKVIVQLPNIYNKLVKELAENYVLEQSSEAIDYFLKTNNKSFLKEVRFLETMQQAIKSVERNRIKTDLPKSYERLTFELTETEIANAIKKKERSNLKEKFKQWDEELKEDEVPVISIEHKKKQEGTKVMQLSWGKYASIAAIFVIGFLIWQPNKLSNDTLFAQYTSEESITQSIDYGKMVTISESGETRGNEVLFDNYTKSETEEAMEAIELFRNGNFEKSKQILKVLNPRVKNKQLLLFLAISQLKTNDVDKSVSNLEYLNTLSSYELKDDVKFYLAVSYIKQNEKGKAKRLLLTIVNNDGKYSKASREILDNMRWF